MTADDLRDRTDLGLPNLPPPPVHACRNGWIGDDEHPTPCPRCRPWLARTADRSGLIATRATRTTTQHDRRTPMTGRTTKEGRTDAQ